MPWSGELPVVLVYAAASLFMIGFIWVIQVLHYPLLVRVSVESFPAYEREHNRRFVPLAGPGSPAAGGSLVALLFVRPEDVRLGGVVTSPILIAAVIVSTALLQAPAHVRLARGLDPAVHRRLVETNWIRTVAWSGQAAIALWMIFEAAR